MDLAYLAKGVKLAAETPQHAMTPRGLRESTFEPWSKVFHFGNPIILAYGKAYAILTFSNVLLTFLL